MISTQPVVVGIGEILWDMLPEGARRMTVYAGLKPATGSFLIDDLVMGMSK